MTGRGQGALAKAVGSADTLTGLATMRAMSTDYRKLTLVSISSLVMTVGACRKSCLGPIQHSRAWIGLGPAAVIPASRACRYSRFRQLRMSMGVRSQKGAHA